MKWWSFSGHPKKSFFSFLRKDWKKSCNLLIWAIREFFLVEILVTKEISFSKCLLTFHFFKKIEFVLLSNNLSSPQWPRHRSLEKCSKVPWEHLGEREGQQRSEATWVISVTTPSPSREASSWRKTAPCTTEGADRIFREGRNPKVKEKSKLAFKMWLCPGWFLLSPRPHCALSHLPAF